jgi:hypothetical protein
MTALSPAEARLDHLVFQFRLGLARLGFFAGGKGKKCYLHPSLPQFLQEFFPLKGAHIAVGNDGN